MANDVFGRPMPDKPTSYPTGRNIAPDPLNPQPQDNPFAGPRPAYGPYPKVERLFSEEQMGARLGIRVNQGEARGMGPATDPTWTPDMPPGGHPIRSAIHRPEEPANTGPTEDPFENLR